MCHSKGEGTPSTFLFLFFIIYKKTLLPLTPSIVNKKNQYKNTKKPFNASYVFFACKRTLVIVLRIWNEKNQNTIDQKLRKSNLLTIHYANTK
jgi:hypothetical protein